MGKRDERIEADLASTWRYAHLSLSLGIFVYASYRFWLLGDSLGLLAWNFCIIFALVVLISTQLLKNTLLGNFWLWGVSVILLGGMLAWNMLGLVPYLYQEIQSGQIPSTELVWMLLIFGPVIGIFCAFMLGAWRSFQNKRVQSHGE